MEHLHILGHDNTSLSVILDIIYQQYGTNAKVTVVSNLKEADNPQKDYAFLHPQVGVTEIFHENWQPTGQENLILGSMGTYVRKMVHRFFQDHHEIEDQQFILLTHPFSALGHQLNIGAGVTINPGVVVAPFATLHPFVYLNRNCSIGHHSTLEAFVSINPGAIVNGKCTIGENTTIGAGAVVNDGVRVGRNSIIGAGAVVTKDIPDHVVAFGSPAKVVKEHHPKFASL